MKYLNLIALMFIFISCDTKDSDEVVNQSEIYAEYKISAKKGSKKIEGEVVFYERGSGIFRDYIALRGSSFVEFQNNRMQEVRTLFDKTKYENNLYTTTTINSRMSAFFKYRNNDGNVFENQLGLPPFVQIIEDSLSVNYSVGAVSIKLSWKYEDPNKCVGDDKCIQIKKYLVIAGTDSGNRVEYIKNFKVELNLSNYSGYIKNIKICSSITSKASGAGSKNIKTSTYCGSTFSI
jgi:hypothetical protein